MPRARSRLTDFRMFVYEPPARALHALYASDRQMTPKLRSFLEFAVQRFGERR
ncbi:LysR family transcriptional regulator [Burkholderia lata]|nr:LysR family transcriptional regulator [Burkholderia lata]